MKKVILPSYKPSGFDSFEEGFLPLTSTDILSFPFVFQQKNSTLPFFYFYPNEMHGKLALIASKVLNVFSLLQQRG